MTNVARIVGYWMLNIITSVSSIMYVSYLNDRDTRIILMQTILLIAVAITLWLLNYSYKCLCEHCGRVAVQALRAMLEPHDE